MITFRVGYKSFFRESSEYHSDYFQAESETTALKVFAKEHRIPGASRQQPDKWQWWDGEYLYQFRVIERIKTIPCPLCRGDGEIAAEQATQLQ